MSLVNPSRFVWFWTFWHWSKESFRGGSLLRSPLNGVGGHWDEWFRNEASVHDRQAIEETGRSESSQRQFIGWLLQHWFREEFEDASRLIPRFVLSELGQLPPFCHWTSFERYRDGYGVSGISAIVLAEGSAGESADVRVIEAVVLPADATAAPVVSEGFQIDSSALTTPRQAAASLLGWKGLSVIFALWVAGGRRPYSIWGHVLFGLGWFAVGGLIGSLLVGPDPGDHLFQLNFLVLILWSALLLHAIIVVGVVCLSAWREARVLRASLEQSQVRLRMKGGLTLKGGSAGLAFCLSILQATYRNHPPVRRTSWIWRGLFEELECEGRRWAVTGVVTADGMLKPVVLGPKFRACLRHAEIRNIFSPYQSDGNQRTVDRMGSEMHSKRTSVLSGENSLRFGFAAEIHPLQSHRGLHVAQSLMTIGGFWSRWQTAMNVFAVFISTIMVMALPDVRNTVLPPIAPAVVVPCSPSPYYLWVSLDTKQAGYFRVVLESGYWANRRADVKSYSGANASVRAEISLHRLDLQTSRDDEDGVIWVERRYRFLNREYALGDRVGRYTVSYLTRMDHE